MSSGVPRVRRFPKRPIVRELSFAQQVAMWKATDPTRLVVETLEALSRLPVSQGEPPNDDD